MSTTVGNLIDRVFREYLEPNDDVVSFTVLKDGLTDSTSDTIIDYDATYLTSEEEDALGTGAFLEVNNEIMLVSSLNTTASQITVKRAARGTTIAAHSTGDTLKINPPFPIRPSRKFISYFICSRNNNSNSRYRICIDWNTRSRC